MRRPACMDDAEWELWRRASDAALIHRIVSPCVECLPDFAAEMRVIGRCDGTPGDPFVPVELAGRGVRYPTAEARVLALRQTWRECARRYRQRTRSVPVQ